VQGANDVGLLTIDSLIIPVVSFYDRALLWWGRLGATSIPVPLYIFAYSTQESLTVGNHVPAIEEDVERERNKRRSISSLPGICSTIFLLANAKLEKKIREETVAGGIVSHQGFY
jgi:hypothetical protein